MAVRWGDAKHADCAGRCVHTDTCIDMCIGMCIDLGTDMCTGMHMGVPILCKACAYACL